MERTKQFISHKRSKSPASTSQRYRCGSGDLLVSGGVQAPPLAFVYVRRADVHSGLLLCNGLIIRQCPFPGRFAVYSALFLFPLLNQMGIYRDVL